MKKILLAAFICFVSFAGFAQLQRTIVKDTTAAGVEQKRSKKKEMAKLNLTKEQRGKMKELAQANKAAKADIQNDSTLTEDQRKQKLRNIKKGNGEQINTILTPDQKQQWMQMRMQKRGKE